MRSMVDAHCDTIVKLMDKQEDLLQNKGHIDLKRLEMFGTPVQFFAVWLNPSFYPISLRKTLEYIDFYYEQLEKNKKRIRHVLSYDDILKNKEDGLLSGLLSLEGGEALEGELSSLRMLYRLGVRAMTLTWNHRNALADGAAERATGGGLTLFGKAVVKEMNRLGMVVDVSHLSEAGFWDVEEIAEAPYIASHSNARGVCDAPRNLSDEQILALAKRGGVLGINLYPAFLTSHKEAAIKDILAHISYIISLAGEDCIGLGCDFDGVDKLPQGIEGVLQIKDVMQAIENEFGEEIADKIAEKNYLRVLKTILK